MKKSVGYMAAVAVYALLVVFVLFLVKRPSADDTEKSPPPEPSINVVVSVVALTTMPDVILLPASVEPEKSVTVAAEVAGAVEWVGVEEGAMVREGDEIAKIDKRTLAAALDQAKANYDLAKSEYDRAEKLFNLSTMSKEQFDSFKVKLDVNKALTELAQVEFDKGTVVSTVSGVLNKRYIERGEYVQPGDPIAEIVRVDKVKVVVDVPEKDIVYIAPGGFMGIVLDESLASGEADLDAAGSFEETMRQAISDRKVVIGKVGYRSVVADQKTRTYRVELDVDNPGQKLLPGMIVRTALLRRVIKDAVAAPLFAVVPRDGRAVVYVENDSRAHERTVKLGVTDGRRIEILEGLSAGDNLIIDGQRQVKDGTLVKVVEGQGTKG